MSSKNTSKSVTSSHSRTPLSTAEFVLSILYAVLLTFSLIMGVIAVVSSILYAVLLTFPLIMGVIADLRYLSLFFYAVLLTCIIIGFSLIIMGALREK